MEIEEYEAEYTYDYNLDVVNIEIKDDYVHKKTIELAFGVFLDFDEKFTPVNFEMICASKGIGVEKDCLINPDGNVSIIVGDDVIKVEVTFKFKNDCGFLKFNALNEFGFPNSESHFALV